MRTPFFVLMSLMLILVNSLSAQENSRINRTIGEFESTIFQADKRGDYPRAIEAARKCSEILKTTDEAKHHGRYCILYYATALANGRGIPQDDNLAFKLIEEEARTDKDGEFSLELAELYLDGKGVSADPIEAAVLVWRVDHGAYSGLCNECDALWAHARALNARLAATLSREQRLRAEAIDEERFPDLAADVRASSTRLAVLGIGLVFTIALLILLVSARAFRGSGAKHRQMCEADNKLAFGTEVARRE